MLPVVDVAKLRGLDTRLLVLEERSLGFATQLDDLQRVALCKFTRLEEIRRRHCRKSALCNWIELHCII